MNDPLQYKLSIENHPFYKVHYITILCTVLCLTLLSVCWKKSQDTRHIQWKSHSSYYSTQGRIISIQNNQISADIYFLGSSITGRIPGMETGIHQWGNLGVDGSSAYEGMNIILSGAVPIPRYAIIETDTLYKPLNHFVFDEGSFTKLGFLGALNNPLYRISSLLYTELRHLKYDISEAYSLKEDRIFSFSPKPKNWNAWDDQCLRKLLSLQEKGCKILLVSFPNKNRVTPKIQHERNLFLTSRLGCSYIDLNAQLSSNAGIQFTDGIHMTCSSAMKIAASLYIYCTNNDSL